MMLQKWVDIPIVLRKLYFSLIKDNELLKKYNKIWEKVRNSIQKEYASIKWKISKIKIKPYKGKIIINFYDDEYWENNLIGFVYH